MAQPGTGGAAADGEEEEEIEHTELQLFRCDEVYVYQLPKRVGAGGYRADEWNVNKWLKEVRMRVVTKGSACSLKLEDQDTGELFAEAPEPQNYLEPVLDSSRYFVIRIEDTSQPQPSSARQRAHAFLGIGFRDRPVAYDFQAALSEHSRHVRHEREAAQMAAQRRAEEESHAAGASDDAAAAAATPKRDMSIKDGQTIRVSLGKKSEIRESGERASPVAAAMPALTKLAPPPPSPTVAASKPPTPLAEENHFVSLSTIDGEAVHATRTQRTMPHPKIAGTAMSVEEGVEEEDDDFGDFQSS